MDVRFGLRKNWCFWTVVLEKTLESPLDCNEIQPVVAKGHQSWMFIGRTDVEAETLILWPPNVKRWLIWKDPDAGKDWRLEKKRTTEDVIIRWHHWLNGREFESTLGVGDGQGGLAFCSPWGREELDTTESLNWTALLLGRKAMTNLDSILQSRDITLPTNVHLVKAMVFQVVMYGCECWTVNKADTKELMLLNCGVWRRFLKIPLTANSKQSILNEISPEC